MALSATIPSLLLVSCLADDQTSVSQTLNTLIRKSTSKNDVYSDGDNTGIIIRTVDFLAGGDENVLPATFWHNDIIAPNQIYPTAGCPWCPNDGWDGFYDTNWMDCGDSGNDGPWEYAPVAVVVGTSMADMFPDFDNIQNRDWGYGVFYPTDSNSCDGRCIYLDNYGGYDCPAGWIDFNTGAWSDDSNQKGSGYFPMGNPFAAQGGGGGSGCHVDSGAIDQQDADAAGNLVGDAACQCNYDYGGDWGQWVEAWVEHAKQKDSFPDRAWLGPNSAKAPQWAMDSAVCWVNNPRDSILLQNEIYLRRFDWNNQKVPTSDWTQGDAWQQRRYWGWNEVPVDSKLVDNEANWDTVFVKLPPAICQKQGDYTDLGGQDSVQCLGRKQQQVLENELGQYVNKGKLLLGFDNVGQRPGSYVLFVREWGTGSGLQVRLNSSWTGSLEWQRYFFCEKWNSPSGKFQIVYHPLTANDQWGACYIDNGGVSPTPSPGPSPSPSPSPSVNPRAIVHGTTGTCLGFANEGAPNGEPLAIFGCSAAESQQWQFLQATSPSLRSLLDASKCMDVSNGDFYNGNTLEIWDCNGYPQQHWTYDQGNQVVSIAGGNGQMCMDLAGGLSADGTPVQLWDCIGNSNQQWQVHFDFEDHTGV